MPNPLHPTAHVLTIAATGASGALFTRELLLTLERDQRVQRVNFIASDNALRVFAEELGIKGRSHLVQQLLGTTSEKVQAQNNDDIGANVA
ncbi:MAG: UbiX family flavin prenyltransferase, partial [Candidatus Angelobacter sp.]